MKSENICTANNDENDEGRTDLSANVNLDVMTDAIASVETTLMSKTYLACDDPVNVSNLNDYESLSNLHDGQVNVDDLNRDVVVHGSVLLMWKVILVNQLPLKNLLICVRPMLWLLMRFMSLMVKRL